jgi:ABC-type multidrug transport system ATPase subunit
MNAVSFSSQEGEHIMPDPILVVHDLSKAYGRRQVLRGINFTVAPGTLVGIVGENGAGKTTLLRMNWRDQAEAAVRQLLDGLRAPDAGDA